MSKTLEGHTLHRYDGELNNVHMMVIEMAGLVLDQSRQALYAFNEQDFEVANLVIQREQNVDVYEVNIDDELVTVTARRSPVAKDLRVIMSLSKAVTDLERVGDEAAKIAHITKEIYDNDRSDPSVHLLRDITTMGKLVIDTLEKAVKTLDTMDLKYAHSIIKSHVRVNIEFQSSLRRLSTFIMEDARNVGHTVSIVLVLKALERIGDHARNLAEHMIYLVEGRDVRHIATLK